MKTVEERNCGPEKKLIKSYNQKTRERFKKLNRASVTCGTILKHPTYIHNCSPEGEKKIIVLKTFLRNKSDWIF